MRDLVLDIDASTGRRAGLENALRDSIRSGRLQTGTKLPSSRALAADTGLARATVVAAYERLACEGYLSARPGSGTCVANPFEPQDPAPKPAPATPPAPIADLRPGEPACGLFPRSAWAKSLRHAVAEMTDQSLGYGDPKGIEDLRHALAKYLGRSRGVVSTCDRISVFAGTTSAMGFLAEMFRSIGIDRIAMEDPGHCHTSEVLQLAGVSPVAVAVDSEGIDVEALSNANVRAVIVTPGSQFPLGMTMSPRRRNELISWAKRTGAWIIEDDYVGEFRYDRQAVAALQGQAPDRVIYAGTASKMLTPGLRISWLAVPPELAQRLSKVKHRRAGVSIIEQRALADFIERGELDRHLTNARAVYRRRQRMVVEAVNTAAPWLEVSPSAAGLHVVAYTDNAAEEARLVEGARQHGITLMGLAPFWLGEATTSGLILGYSRPAQYQFAGALKRLEAFLEAM